MAYKEDEKTLAADIKTSLLEEFEKQWKARGQVQKRAVAAALRFWMSLPEDLQAKLISEELGEDDFLSLITQIIDDRIRAIKQSLYKDIRKKPISRPRSAIRHPVKRQAGKARRKS